MAKAIGCGRVDPGDISDPHGHHIVYKADYNHTTDMKKQLIRSKDVLANYGISINDCSNLMIASKGVGVHTAENAKKVADLLEAKDKILKEQMRCGKINQKQADKAMEKHLQIVGVTVFGGYK